MYKIGSVTIAIDYNNLRLSLELSFKIKFNLKFLI